VFEDRTGFGGNSIDSPKAGMANNKMGMLVISSYSWVEINCKF
jgi:hypothetical protein